VTERVDLDRLADFVGGALDGTPDAAAVRTLIDTDPAWAAAHADLVAATSAVSADLRAVGSRPHAVPEDVAGRLDAFLRRLELEATPAAEPDTAPAPRSESGPGAPGAPPGTRQPGGAAAGGPGTRRGADSRGPGGTDSRGPGGVAMSGPRGTGPGRRGQHRRAKWAAALSAAAAVIAVGVGFVALVPGAQVNQDSATNAPAGDAGAAAPQAAGGPTPFASGRDYRPGSFAGLGSGLRAGEAQPPQVDANKSAQPGRATDVEPGGGENYAQATIAPELARLTGAVARQACLDAIRQTHGGVPSVLEFARYTGRPALIVRLEGSSSGDGKPLVVVVGPDCGLVAGDADEYHYETLA
jgi:hypothetical protein